MNDLQSTFLILSASFFFTSCCFCSGITLKPVAFQLEALCLCCCVYSRKTKLAVLYEPTFCHATFQHALITFCNVSRAGYIAYHDQDTFDFSQGHVTKNQPKTVCVQLSESLGNSIYNDMVIFPNVYIPLSQTLNKPIVKETVIHC